MVAPTIHYANADIYCCDCLTVLRQLPDESVNCCITSPPYYGLRDYGVDGQVGLEETPEEYVAKMAEIFREVRRVLRDDGTVWLNLGDSYNGSVPNHTGQSGYNDGRTNRDKRFSVGGIHNIKPKDLIGIPWRVAFALQADGWYLRQDIIWHKPNPMPESVTDRCTKAHEYIFLLSKSARYWYDNGAIREDNETNRKRNENKVSSSDHCAVKCSRAGSHPDGRNKRSVWTIPTHPYTDAHFAVFPPDLIVPCVRAGCPVDGTVLDPFAGSGTTGLVSLENGRKFVGIELNPEYLDLIRKRIHGAATQMRLEL